MQYYEKGERDGKPVEIPRYIALACFALSVGVSAYDGPDEVKAVRKKSAKADGADSALTAQND